MKTLSKLITEVNMLDRVTIKVPSNVKNSYTGIAKEFDGVRGSIIGVENNSPSGNITGKAGKMYRVKFDKPVMITDVGEVSSDLFPASWLKK